MGDRRTEVGVPRVEVRVEVHDGDRAVQLVHDPQQRQGDGVVAADGHQLGAAVERRPRALVDLLDRVLDVERVAGDVAGVGDLLDGERLDVLDRVVGAQQLAGRADVRRDRTGRRGGS